MGMEACGDTQWFERLAELGHELWLGEAAQIRASMVRRQKTDEGDAKHILELLLQESFLWLWVEPGATDTRRLLLHRHHMVRSRTPRIIAGSATGNRTRV